MKNSRFFFVFLLLITCFLAQAWMEIDNQIQLTGSGVNGMITGIKQVPEQSAAASAQSIQENSLTFSANGGTANAYSVTLSPAVSSYTTG